MLEEVEPQSLNIGALHVRLELLVDDSADGGQTVVPGKLGRYFLQGYSRKVLLHQHVLKLENPRTT